MKNSSTKSSSSEVKEQVKRIGGLNFAHASGGTYAVAYGGMNDIDLRTVLSLDGLYEANPYYIGGVKVIPNGADNNLPAFVRNLLEKNNLGPGIITRKIGLQQGQGPFLYSLKFENDSITRQWTEDAEIQAWLDTWNYKKFVRECLMEYNYGNGIYVKYITGLGQRYGKAWISELKCETANECRFEWPETDSSIGTRLEDVTNIIVWDFENMRIKNPPKRYPVFDPQNPAAYPVSMKYHSFRSFGRNFYSLPSFYGSIPWIERANDIPEIIKYLTENMIAAAYQVHEPAEYWETKMNMLREMHSDYDEKKLSAELDKLRDELTKTIANVLAGKKNAGKFFESIDFVDENGTLCEWKIEPIEMNIDKYIDAQTKISVLADSSTTSGLGLNPALSNIIIEGKGDAGSQILYAWKLFYAADTQIVEDIVFEAMNTALKINFPNKKLAMGLYTPIAAKESDLSASARPTAKV